PGLRGCRKSAAIDSCRDPKLAQPLRQTRIGGLIMTPGSNSNITYEDFLWGIGHGAFDDPLGRSLVRAWKLGAADNLVRQLSRERVQRLRMKQMTGELPPFKTARPGMWKLLFGDDWYGQPVGVDLHSLCAGVQVASNTGGGKSNLLVHMAS